LVSEWRFDQCLSSSIFHSALARFTLCLVSLHCCFSHPCQLCSERAFRPRTQHYHGDLAWYSFSDDPLWCWSGSAIFPHYASAARAWKFRSCGDTICVSGALLLRAGPAWSGCSGDSHPLLLCLAG